MSEKEKVINADTFAQLVDFVQLAKDKILNTSTTKVKIEKLSGVGVVLTEYRTHKVDQIVFKTDGGIGIRCEYGSWFNIPKAELMRLKNYGGGMANRWIELMEGERESSQLTFNMEKNNA